MSHFSAVLNLLTAADLLLVALKTLKGLLTAASKKQMYGAASSVWKPSCSGENPQDLALVLFLSWVFFCANISPCLGCTCGHPG